MPYKLLENNKLLNIYENFKQNQKVREDLLDLNYLKMRKFIKQKYSEYKEKNIEKYDLDLFLALDFYEFLNSQPDFNRTYESSNEFWKYIAICVIPDIIADRHGIDKEEYFHKKSVRIYPYALYWYIHLSWQGNRDDTYQILKNNTTDEILQLVERPTKIGINLELYRKIMYTLSNLDKKDKYTVANDKKITKFRVVLMKNTSKLVLLRPEIYPGGLDKYVEMLFEGI